MLTAQRVELAADELAEIEQSIAAVRFGLRTMDVVANTATAAWDRTPRLVRLAVGLIGVSLLLTLWWSQRADAEDESKQ